MSKILGKHPDGSNCYTVNCRRRSFGETVGLFPTQEQFIKEIENDALFKKTYPFTGVNPELANEIEKKRVLFESDPNIALLGLHGSHLYRMSHPESDLDFYTVYFESGRTSARQNKSGDMDELKIPFTVFVEQAKDGRHQALETMFSSEPIGDRIADFRKSFRVGTNVWAVYLRTIKKFAHDDGIKRNRHAVRLTLNLNELVTDGRFTTELAKKQLHTVHRVSSLTNKDDYFEELQKISTLDIHLA